MESANWKKQKVQFRRGTAAEWTARNTLLLPGEVGFETDTKRFKVGNGVTRWPQLEYWTGGDLAGLYVAEGDPRLSDSREWSGETVPQAEAVAGAATTRRAWTALRVFQAVSAWWAGSADKIKLDGITAGATANSSDADLRDRGTHTGTQAISTVSGLQSALDDKSDTGHAHDDLYYTETEVNGLLDGKQAAGMYATLVNGTVPSNQLPSYSDDVLEYATAGDLPVAGESGKMYVVASENKVYRWSGSQYIAIVGSPGTTDAVAEGSANLYYTDARAAAAAPVQSVAGRTGAISLAGVDIASGTIDDARLSANVVLTNDARLSNSRAPTGSAGGDLSGTYPNPSLANTAVTPGAYGSGSAVATFTVDSKGRLTAASDTTIAISTAAVSGLAASATTDTTNAANISSGTLPFGRIPTGATSTTVCVGNDARLSDSRAPTGTAGGSLSGTYPSPTIANSGVSSGSYGSAAQVATFTVGADGRLSAASNTTIAISTSNISGLAASATTDTTNASNITSGTTAYARLPVGSTASTVCAGNDARLTDSRTPTAHKSSHQTGGSDALSPSDIGAAPAANPAFTGAATFSATAGVAMTITNTGTGNSFVVNDASGDTTPFVIDADGRVAIGTHTPTSLVDMRALTATPPQLRITAIGNAGTSAAPASRGSIAFPNYNLARELVTLESLGREANFLSGMFVISVANATGTSESVFTIDNQSSAATFGVRTTLPLHCSSTINASTGTGASGSYLPGVVFSGDPNTGIQQVGGADNFSIVTGGFERVRIKSTGAVRFAPLASDPASGEGGDVYYNSTTNKLRVYNGTSWIAYALAAGATFTGTTTFNGPITEGYVAGGDAGTAKTLALTNGTVQAFTLTGNCTFTMPIAVAGQSFTLLLKTGATPYTAAFTGVKWPGGTAPTITTTNSKLDVVAFVSDGTNWYGSISQNYGV